MPDQVENTEEHEDGPVQGTPKSSSQEHTFSHSDKSANFQDVFRSRAAKPQSSRTFEKPASSKKFVNERLTNSQDLQEQIDNEPLQDTSMLTSPRHTYIYSRTEKPGNSEIFNKDRSSSMSALEDVFQSRVAKPQGSRKIEKPATSEVSTLWSPKNMAKKAASSKTFVNERLANSQEGIDLQEQIVCEPLQDTSMLTSPSHTNMYSRHIREGKPGYSETFNEEHSNSMSPFDKDTSGIFEVNSENIHRSMRDKDNYISSQTFNENVLSSSSLKGRSVAGKQKVQEETYRTYKHDKGIKRYATADMYIEDSRSLVVNCIFQILTVLLMSLNSNHDPVFLCH